MATNPQESQLETLANELSLVGGQPPTQWETRLDAASSAWSPTNSPVPRPDEMRPRGNPAVEEFDLERGREKLERVGC